jgi:SpoVK/Ycf46/Vps4 family AAA+-type ATPase
VLTAQTEKDLRSVLSLLVDPARAAKFGVAVPTGLLLAGPPGTGKTSIAKALAAEAGTSFYAIAPGELTSKWQGDTEAKVRRLFERARENAPSIIFIDEIDSFAAERGTDSGSGGERILTTLLAEIDGFGGGAAGGRPVFVIGATNRPEVIDPALTRPGRLSRTVEIGLPDLPARMELLTRMTAGMPLAADVDLALLAEVTDGLSPAGLRGLCEEAAVRAMQSLGPDAEPMVDAAAFVGVLDPARVTPV